MVRFVSGVLQSALMLFAGNAFGFKFRFGMRMRYSVKFAKSRSAKCLLHKRA